MDRLAKWTIVHRNVERTIELLRGDLAELPAEHSVDLLVISAFRNDYIPTATSLVGSLYDAGISVQKLAEHKKMDVREEFSCWLSDPLPNRYAFRHILCIESGWHGSPPEITDDLFRALTPCLLTSIPEASVAMPLIGTGDQGWPASQMMESILKAAISWINRGLQLRLLKIVVRSQTIADSALKQFHEIQTQHTALEPSRGPEFDLFISYCHKDLQAAKTIERQIQCACPQARIFCDRSSLQVGTSWLMQVAESLDNSKRVAALYTPDYWCSASCKDEFTAALARQNDMGKTILFPIYYRTARIPYLFRNLEFADCREGDNLKLTEACHTLGRCFFS